MSLLKVFKDWSESKKTLLLLTTDCSLHSHLFMATGRLVEVFIAQTSKDTCQSPLTALIPSYQPVFWCYTSIENNFKTMLLLF